MARVGSNINNVLQMHKAIPPVTEMIIMEVQEFEAVFQVIQLLRERKPVLLNLASLEQQQAQRVVDFVVGGTYAIEGEQEQVDDRIFLFTPACVQITTSKSD